MDLSAHSGLEEVVGKGSVGPFGSGRIAGKGSVGPFGPEGSCREFSQYGMDCMGAVKMGPVDIKSCD